MAFVAGSNYPSIQITSGGTYVYPVARFNDAAGNGFSTTLFPHINLRISGGTLTVQFDSGSVVSLAAGNTDTDSTIVAIPPGAMQMTFVVTGGAGAGVVGEYGREF